MGERGREKGGGKERRSLGGRRDGEKEREEGNRVGKGKIEVGGEREGSC